MKEKNEENARRLFEDDYYGFDFPGAMDPEYEENDFIPFDDMMDVCHSPDSLLNELDEMDLKDFTDAEILTEVKRIKLN